MGTDTYAASQRDYISIVPRNVNSKMIFFSYFFSFLKATRHGIGLIPSGNMA